MGSRGEKHQLRQSSLEKLTILPTGILTGSQTTQRQEYSHWLLLSAQARLASQRNAGKKQRGPRRTTRKWQQKWQAGKVAVERAKALGCEVWKRSQGWRNKSQTSFASWRETMHNHSLITETQGTPGGSSFPGIRAGRALSRWGLGSLPPTGSPAGHQRPSHS